MFQRYLVSAFAILWVSIGATYGPRPIWFLTLPIVFLAIIYLHTRRLSWWHQGLFLLTGLLVALLLYLAALEAPGLLRLLQSEPPQQVTNLATLGWSVLNGMAVLVLLTLLYQEKNMSWRATLAGIAGGGVLLILLAYPVYAGLVNTYIPTRTFAGPQHLIAATLYGLAAFVLLLSLGPVTVVWSRAHTDGQRLAVGAIAGLAAGIMVYALVGTAVAGIAAQAPLYAVAVSRIGFEEAAYVSRLGLAINQTYPFVLGAFWLLVAGVPLITGLAGWVMPPRANARTRAYPPVWPLSLLLLVPPVLYVGLVVQISVTTLLSQQIAEVVRHTHWWNPMWLTGVIGLQLWLAASGVQILGLVWLMRFPTASRLRGVAAWSGYLSGVGTLLLMLLFSWINPYFLPKLWPFSLLTTLLNLALIGAGWRLTHAPTPTIWQEERPSLLIWVMTGGWAMVIALIIIYPFVAAALAMVHVAVAMIESLSQVTSPPPGIAWLVTLLEGYAETQGALTAVLLAAACGIGGIVGCFIHLFVPRHRQRYQSKGYGRFTTGK